MTLLIIFLAMTNMALGYGLAIYFGQVQLPVLTKLPQLRLRKAAAGAAAADLTVSSESSDLLQPTDSDPAPDPAIEATKSAEPEAQSPPLVAAKQLDLTDLMPEAESTVATEDSASDVQAQVSEADDPTGAPSDTSQLATVDEPMVDASVAVATDSQAGIEAKGQEVAVEGENPATEAKSADTESAAKQPSEIAPSETEALAEATTDGDPAEIVPVAAAVEPEQSEAVDPVPATAAKAQVEVNPAVNPEQDIEQDIKGFEQENSTAMQEPPADRAALSEEDTPTPVNEFDQAIDPAAETGNDAKAGTDDLESLAQQLQTAMAGANEAMETATDTEEEIAEDTAEGKAEETVEETAEEKRIVPQAEPSKSDAHAVSEYAASGLESFQLQLKEQGEQNTTEAVGAARQESSDIRSPAIDEAPLEATVLEGIEAFQAQLQKQQQGPASDDTSVLDGGAESRTQLQSQQDLAADATEGPGQADEVALEPEILEGIESFRAQLAKMNA